ncbi:hypothetical protein NLI96_g12219 [Meripilus lineatus]|uniref:DUF4142 domain-containing protein n=1 Tax=Meripilus lineatus TaxID=2056292 RepID=A0AAD5UQI2_9APHY|nr:hypothetical protein NLI96_g12219 [Physisporinus lineatus]
MFTKALAALAIISAVVPGLAYSQYPDLYVRDYDDLIAREDLQARASYSSRNGWSGAAANAMTNVQSQIASHQAAIHQLESAQRAAQAHAKSSYRATDRQVSKMFSREPSTIDDFMRKANSMKSYSQQMMNYNTQKASGYRVPTARSVSEILERDLMSWDLD